MLLGIYDLKSTYDPSRKETVSACNHNTAWVTEFALLLRVQVLVGVCFVTTGTGACGNVQSIACVNLDTQMTGNI